MQFPHEGQPAASYLNACSLRGASFLVTDEINLLNWSISSGGPLYSIEMGVSGERIIWICMASPSMR